MAVDMSVNLSDGVGEIPTRDDIKHIWINLYGVRNIDQEQLKYLADICLTHPQSEKIFMNANEKTQEELEVFSRVHDVAWHSEAEQENDDNGQS